MSNLIIFSDGNSVQIENIAKKYTDFEVRVLDINEITNAETFNPAIIIIDVSMEKLKDISMVTKFTVPVLTVVDKIPENITVRGEAFDYIVNPVNEYEFSVKIKNLIKIKDLRDKISNISTKLTYGSDQVTAPLNILQCFSKGKRVYDGVWYPSLCTY